MELNQNGTVSPVGALQSLVSRIFSTRVKRKPLVRAYPKIGRNEKCPCGSGMKFKHCHYDKVK